MLVANYTEFRTALKKYLDLVEMNDETLIVKRGAGKGTVMISLDHYNAMMETEYLLSTAANRKHLDGSIAQMRKGKTVKRDIKEDE
ncbi:MAG: type II toxin-antitoxin system Phd/YefM family antitoxin [Fidelibacterota bacterium]